MTAFWCETAMLGGAVERSVRITAEHGIVTSIGKAPAQPGDTVLDTVFPGMGNAHSHAFHRALRGRTHSDGGDFWRWRDAMYAAAGRLDPDTYYDLATGVFAEMLTAGFTAVAEFHYVHHRPDGSPYPEAHAMEKALAAAAATVGIRLRLLDTVYLRGGSDAAGDRPLSAAQRRFGDLRETPLASADAWLARFDSLRETLGEHAVGAAIHSVRAVPRAAIERILARIDSTIPLHIHLSEQPQENADCFDEYDLTPTALLHELGALTPRLSVVHATHLTYEDIDLLGAGGVTVVMCPTTEADLGDGIGPARELLDAGAVIALGSDQNAVVDPLLEARGLEAGERLGSGQRGRFSPAQLTAALTSNGYRSLGIAGLAVGAPCDLVELNSRSVRTLGSAPDQLVLTATASDVGRVIVDGRIVAAAGMLANGTHPAELLEAALQQMRE